MTTQNGNRRKVHNPRRTFTVRELLESKGVDVDALVDALERNLARLARPKRRRRRARTPSTT